LSSSVIQPNANVSLRRKLLWWLPTLVWLCLQAFFSTDTFSAENTATILWRIAHALDPGISTHQFEVLHFLVRKSAHFCTYGVLGTLAFFSWRATLAGAALWSFRWSALAVLAVAVAGSLDEFHQAFVPSRTASALDVLLDTIGGICFQILLAVMIRRRVRQKS